MKIHVVCRHWQSDRVLPRMARYLAEGNGWGVGEQPDPHADLNYYDNYLIWNGWKQTPVASYFTHRDGANPAKAKQWDDRAQAVDLRIATAEMYAAQLRQFGATVICRAPLEFDRFTPAKRPAGGRPVVGVSGYAGRDSRKGEQLIARLAQSAIGQRVTWQAAGRYWPVPTTGYSWADMPSFYRSLDVFVLPSLIEGVPMTVLEAMACGVRCVVPEHVGVVDELPGIPDLVRYKAGDYGSLEAALGRALEMGATDQGALRRAVSGFTVQNWCHDHLVAFEDLLSPVAPPLADWRGRAGVYVVAYGEPARKCAVRLIKSIRAQMPGLPVAVASNKKLGCENVFIGRDEVDIGARWHKLHVWELAPARWEYVLYLDADTELSADVSALFAHLQAGWELVICKNPQRFHIARHMVRPDNKEECQQTVGLYGTDEIMQWNGGVFAFRRCKAVRQFFEAWCREWDRWAKRDQAALLRAMYTNPVRMLPLTNYWNLDPKYAAIEGKEAAILHYPLQARRHRGIVAGRGDSPEAWDAVRQFEKAGVVKA